MKEAEIICKKKKNIGFIGEDCREGGR